MVSNGCFFGAPQIWVETLTHLAAYRTRWKFKRCGKWLDFAHPNLHTQGPVFLFVRNPEVFGGWSWCFVFCEFAYFKRMTTVTRRFLFLKSLTGTTKFKALRRRSQKMLQFGKDWFIWAFLESKRPGFQVAWKICQMDVTISGNLHALSWTGCAAFATHGFE